MLQKRNGRKIIDFQKQKHLKIDWVPENNPSLHPTSAHTQVKNKAEKNWLAFTCS